MVSSIFDMNNFIYYKSFFCIQLNVTKYYYVSNNSIKHQSFVYTVKWSKSSYFKQFHISHLFGNSTFNRHLNYRSGPEWFWEWWQWREIPHFPKLLHHWNLTIRLFSVISRTFVVVVGGGGVLLHFLIESYCYFLKSFINFYRWEARRSTKFFS